MSLSVAEKSLIRGFVDTYDINPGNGLAERIDARNINAAFMAGFRQTFAPEGQSNDPAYVHQVGRKLSNHMNLKGARRFFNSLFNRCGLSFQSVLCKSPQEGARLNLPSVMKTEHAKKVRSAIRRISRAYPKLGRTIQALARSGKILFSNVEMEVPAFIDPRSGTIVLTKNSFRIQARDATTSFGALRPGIIGPETMRQLFGEPAPQAHNLFYNSSGHGDVGMKIAEILVHEQHHLEQMNAGNPINGYRDAPKTTKRPSGYYYDFLSYMRLFALALDRKGIKAHSISDGADRWLIGAENLLDPVGRAFHTTEREAERTARIAIRKIASKTK